MPPTELENLEAEVWEQVCALGYRELDTACISEIVGYLATTHRLIDLEKVEALRRGPVIIASGLQVSGCKDDIVWNNALDAVIALVKGEK